MDSDASQVACAHIDASCTPASRRVGIIRICARPVSPDRTTASRDDADTHLLQLRFGRKRRIPTGAAALACLDSHAIGARLLASLRSGAANSRKYENTTFRAQNLRCAFVHVAAASFEHFAPALQLLR